MNPSRGVMEGGAQLVEHDGWSSEAEAEAANAEAFAWTESVRRYNRARARKWRAERAAYHRHLIAVFEAQAQRHRTELLRLMDGKV